MRLSLHLHYKAGSSKVYIVDWNDELGKFPKTVKFNGDYFDWTSYDTVNEEGCDFMLEFCTRKEYSLPRDMHGQLFPVSDLGEMFGLYKEERKVIECECGANHTSEPNKHLSYCPMNLWRL